MNQILRALLNKNLWLFIRIIEMSIWRKWNILRLRTRKEIDYIFVLFRCCTGLLPPEILRFVTLYLHNLVPFLTLSLHRVSMFYQSKCSIQISWLVFSPINHLSSPQILPFPSSWDHRSSRKYVSWPMTKIDIVSIEKTWRALNLILASISIASETVR